MESSPATRTQMLLTAAALWVAMPAYSMAQPSCTSILDCAQKTETLALEMKQALDDPKVKFQSRRQPYTRPRL